MNVFPHFHYLSIPIFFYIIPLIIDYNLFYVGNNKNFFLRVKLLMYKSLMKSI